jgi:predicted small metal-binding protein
MTDEQKDTVIMCTCGWTDDQDWATEEEALKALVDHLKTEHGDK